MGAEGTDDWSRKCLIVTADRQSSLAAKPQSVGTTIKISCPGTPGEHESTDCTSYYCTVYWPRKHRRAVSLLLRRRFLLSLPRMSAILIHSRGNLYCIFLACPCTVLVADSMSTYYCTYVLLIALPLSAPTDFMPTWAGEPQCQLLITTLGICDIPSSNKRAMAQAAQCSSFP
jgi:hypothetical protein